MVSEFAKAGGVLNKGSRSLTQADKALLEPAWLKPRSPKAATTPARGLGVQALYPTLCVLTASVGYWPTVAMTGSGELGFDSREGA